MNNYCIDILRQIRTKNNMINGYKHTVSEAENFNLSIDFMLEDIAGSDADIIKKHYIENVAVKDIAEDKRIPQRKVTKAIKKFKKKVKEYAKES